MARIAQEDDGRDHSRVRGDGRTVVEAKTEVVCCRTKVMPEATTYQA